MLRCPPPLESKVIAAAMASLEPWVGVLPDLLRFISDGFGLPLESYSSIRGVCTALRSALPAPAPLLLAVSGSLDCPRHPQIQPGQLLSASFLAAGRTFHLSEISTGRELVGSSNGWIAVDPIWPGIFLLNPTADDYTAVTICGPRRLAYARTRDMSWTVMDVAMAKQGDKLADLVYDAGGGKVYCVTAHGDVHVFHAPGRRRRRPRVAPLHADRAGGLFAPPYDTASKLLTGAKGIFISGGRLHQAWRNTSIAFSSMTPDGGRFSMAKDEIVVLKYDPERRPCWGAVADLGGRSVFIGKNNPVVLRPEDASGVRPNCVYWIDERRSRFQPMVFDMATRTSTPHPFDDAEAPGHSARRPLCWFFLNDKIESVDAGRR